MIKQYVKLPTNDLNNFVTMLFLHCYNYSSGTKQSALPGQTSISYSVFSTVHKYGNVELASLME